MKTIDGGLSPTRHVPSAAAASSHGAWLAPAGATLLATCVCGMGQIVFGVAAARSMAVAANSFGATIFTGIMALATAMIVFGLWGRSRAAGRRAVLGGVLFWLGYLLAPPMVMNARHAHTSAHLIGFLVVLAGIAGLVWAFLTAFPARNRRAATGAAAGFGAAVGCSCCLASGAATWLAVALTGVTIPGGPFGDGIPYVIFMGAAVVFLQRLGGNRVAALALAGAVVSFGGDEVLKLLADDIERLPRLIVAFAGTAIIMVAFARGFSPAPPTVPAVLSPDDEPRRGPPVRPRRRMRAAVGV